MKSAIITLIVIILVAIGVTYAITGFDSSEETQSNNRTATSTESDENDRSEVRTINAKHDYVEGTHTIAGEINMPTPCDLLEVDANVSTTTKVVLEFSVVNESETCAQVVTAQRFKVSFEADENADISATYAGKKAILNLIEVPEGESLDDFEVFIKG